MLLHETLILPPPNKRIEYINQFNQQAEREEETKKTESDKMLSSFKNSIRIALFFALSSEKKNPI